MPQEKPQPQNPDQQFLSMARQRLSQINELEMTDEEKELAYHLIDEAQGFEKDKKLAKAIKVYRELMDFLESIKVNLKIPLSERWKEKWDWQEQCLEVLDLKKIETKHGESSIGVPIFSPDGEEYLWTLEKKDGKYLYKNKDLIGEFPNIYNYNFSPDGKSVYGTFNDLTGKSRAFVNDDIWPQSFDDMDVEFSPDSKAVIAVGSNKEVAETDIIDGEEVPTYRTTFSAIIKDKEVIRQSADEWYQTPVFSPDHSRWACQIIDDDGWSLLVDGNRWPQSFQEWGIPVFSPDGQKVAASFTKDPEGVGVAINGKKAWSDYYEDCSLYPTFSPDGKKIAVGMMIKQGDDGYAVIENGVRKWESEFNHISDLIYSPDSKNIALVVSGGLSSAIFINDEVIPSVKGHTFTGIQRLTWSPDGKKILYVGVENGKYYRVVQDVSKLLNKEDEGV